MTPDAPSPESLPARKAALRAEVRLRLRGLDPEQRKRESAALCRRLTAAPEWSAAGTVLGFSALPAEPDPAPALQTAARAGLTVALPRWDADLGEYRPALLPPDGGLVPGPFGVPEPAPSSPWVPVERLDLVLVPGLAFDRRGRRLGRGRGFFDRLLARAPTARRWGVAFDLQIVAEVPTEPHDLNVHLLVTPGLWLPIAPVSSPPGPVPA
jgi:5-formyltetrahydrofolate cyclo-ligase